MSDAQTPVDEPRVDLPDGPSGRDAEVEARKAAAWDAQHRSDETYMDRMDLLEAAVSDKFGEESGRPWVTDFTDEWLIYTFKGEKFQVPYTVDGTTIELGEATEVHAKTSYEPIESKSAPRDPATPKRAFSSFVEQPPPTIADVGVRMDDAGDGQVIARFVGYASPTGVPYSVRDWLGEYEETMLPGCFAKTLREQPDIPLLFNHDGVPLASTGSETMQLAEAPKGLRNEADLDRRDALTNSICVQVSRGVLGKQSISFQAIKDIWNDAFDKRGVGEARLYDTSIVTYPASPTAGGELVEAMRSALGREGRSLWLAEHEMSVRSALPAFEPGGLRPGGIDDTLERALRALVHADEVVCRSHGPHGRARTFLVARSILEVRAGAALSAKNKGLLQGALDALSSADKAHGKLAGSHAKAAENLSTVLEGSADASTKDGKDSNQGAGASIVPDDGGGPRSANPHALARERERELAQLRGQR